MKKNLIAIGIMLLLLIVGLSGCVKELIWLQQEKLQVLNGDDENGFGISVSINKNTGLVGVFLDDDNGLDSGSAYVFQRNGDSWTQQAKLLPSDGAEYDEFGISVSISEDTAIIGAYKDDDNGLDSGSAYVFQRNGDSWTQQAKLLPSDGAEYDEFGISVSISEDTAIIGAYKDDDNGLDSGSAYVFQRNGDSWTQQAKLLPSDGAEYDEFGISVSISEDTAIIGAYKDDDNGLDSGSAYVFQRNGDSWTQQARLLPLDGAEYDEFGISVSIDGDTALIGKHYDSYNGWDSGSAYVFQRNGDSWTQQAKLLPSDGAEYDEFGISVSIDGDTALIGAFGDDDNGWDSGSAYVFQRNGDSWTQQARLLPLDGAEDDEFGISVSIDGDTALIGSQNFNDESAFIFKKSPLGQI